MHGNHIISFTAVFIIYTISINTPLFMSTQVTLQSCFRSTKSELVGWLVGFMAYQPL